MAEFSVPNNKNYRRLAQFYYSNDSRNDIIKEIKRNNAINFQVPGNFELQQIKSNLEGCTALHLAFKVNDFIAFKKLIQKGADFTIKNNNGETIVHEAMNTPVDHFNIKPLELQRPFDSDYITTVLSSHVSYNNSTNPCNRSGLSHFHVACMVGHLDAMMHFLRNGQCVNEAISINSPNLPGFTPLHCAARYFRLKAGKMLLIHKAIRIFKDARGATPFHLLIEQNMAIMDWMHFGKRAYCPIIQFDLTLKEKFIVMLLRNRPIPQNNMMELVGMSYLHIVSTLQDTSLVKEALEGNVDLDECIKADSPFWPGYTALHFAAHFNMSTVKLLIEKGANMFVQDAKGITPFNICLERCKAEDVEYLIVAQTDWNYICFSDDTFIHTLIHAMRNKHLLKSFLEYVMTNVNVVISSDSPIWPGFSPLHLAVSFVARYKDVNDILNQISNTVDPINFEDFNNLFDKSDMHNCSLEEDQLYLERIKMMLEANAKVNIQDLQGSTPLHHAFRLQRENVVNMLLQFHKSIKVNPINHKNLSHLHIACANGNYQVVLELLTESDADINLAVTHDFNYRKTYENSNVGPANCFFTAGSTPLHFAVIARETDIAKLLINFGANLYAKDDRDMTPIHRLIAHNFHYRVPEISKVLFAEADLRDCVTSFGLSHLHVASHVNNVKAIERLLDIGAKINGKVKYKKLEASNDQSNGKSEDGLSFLSSYYYNYTPLDFAVNDYCMDAFVTLLRRGSQIINNPLKRLRPANLNLFLESFIDIEDIVIPEGLYKKVKLHMACFCFDVNAVNQLLTNGDNPNERVPKNFKIWSRLTPLHILLRPRDNCPEEKVIDIVRLLVSHGADTTLKSPDDFTPIHMIDSFKSNSDSLKKRLGMLLLVGHRNFSSNPIDARGISHFHVACICNEVVIVEEFLKEGVDINQAVPFFSPEYAGYTPLHCAVYYQSEETVNLLLEYNANIHVQDSQGNTPLHHALACIYGENSNDNITRRLIRAGALLNVENTAGLIPLEMIMRMNGGPNRFLHSLPENFSFVNIFNKKSQYGYIAMAIKNERKIKRIIQNPLYAAVMNAPNINKYDHMKRTPIHNIVAIPKVEASVKIYIKAIHIFIKLGFNINQQNINGDTAIHYAGKFQNSKAVRALLDLGADISIMNLNLKTPLLVSIDKVPTGLNIYLFQRIQEMLSIRVYKLNMLNLSRNQYDYALSIKCIESLRLYRCLEELKRLKIRTVGPFSLFDFLSDTNAVSAYPHLKIEDREAVDTLFEDRHFYLRRDFPEFSGILQMNYTKACYRIHLIQTSKKSLDNLIKFCLPYLCSYEIFKFLTNGELTILNISEKGRMSSPRKRKRLDSDNNRAINNG